MTDDTPSALRHLVILGHPSERSLNRAIASAYCTAVREQGQIATLRDLYAMRFDPVLKPWEQPGAVCDGVPEIHEEIRRVQAADAIVLVYPVWLGGPPAILKGYLDRVLGAGFHDGDFTTVARGRHLLTLSTSDTRDAARQASAAALRAACDRCLVDAMGFRDSRHLHFDGIAHDMEEAAAIAVLEQARAAAHRLCAELARASRAPAG